MVTADRKSDKTCIILLVATIEGVWTHFAKVTTFEILLTLRDGISRKKSCNFSSYVSIFMKFHTMIEKTLSEHRIMVILQFWAKNVVFNKK